MRRLFERRWKRGLAIALAVSAFFAGTIYAGTNVKSWVDPDAGLSRSQIEAAQADSSAAFWAKYPSWVIEQETKGIDLATVPQAAILANVSYPSPTLSDSAHRATLIVEGSVRAISFRGTGDSLVSIDVLRTLKGKDADSIDVVFAGGLRPVPDWDHVTLAFLEAAPMPKPHDHIVLFLQDSSTDVGAYEPQIWTGIYGLDPKGLLVPLSDNPFASEMTPLDVTALARAVSASN